MIDGFETFFQGLGLGLAIAAPVGPIGVICIRRTLLHGMPSGFVAGLGAAAADTLYGAVAALGLVAVMQGLGAIRPALQGGGAIFLLYLAWSIWRSPPMEIAGEPGAAPGRRRGALARGFVEVFLLTLANPATILSFLAIFAALGLAAGAEAEPSAALSLVAGVGLGSAAWWLTLSGGVGLLRSRIGGGALVAINRLSAVSLTGFALWAAWGLLAD